MGFKFQKPEHKNLYIKWDDDIDKIIIEKPWKNCGAETMKEYIKGLWINEGFFNEDDIELRRDGVTYVFRHKKNVNDFWCVGINYNVIKCNDNTVFEWEDNDVKLIYQDSDGEEVRIAFMDKNITEDDI